MKTIVPLAFMASESIAHEAELEPIRARGIIVKYQEQIRETRKFHVLVAQRRQRNVQ